MIEIGNKIVSLDVVREKFVCDLEKCKGQCCVDGDAGAPLEESELQELENIFPAILPYLTERGKEAIDKLGYYVVDPENDYVTPLAENSECAYCYFENGIAKCAIEKAYFEKKVTFRKPVSCHLYPIRISEYKRFDGVNYNRLSICAPARELGEKLNVSVCQFLKEPIIRKYGQEWFDQLALAEKEIKDGNL